MFEKLLKIYYKRFGVDRYYYQILDQIFGIYPNNIELYKLALIHRSASLHLDNGTVINNERLEFLGDSILESIVSDYLYIEYPSESEGYLTQMRSKIVSRTSLNALCLSLGLDNHVIYQTNGNYTQKHIWGDAMEAMLGAIYLDKGYEFTNRLIINDLLRNHIDLEEISATETDFKSRIIEWCQKSRRTIVFNTNHAAGSTPKNPLFTAVVVVDGLEIGFGSGSSKKEAEQDASFSVSEIMVSDEVGDSILDMFDQSMEKEQNI